MIETLSGLLTPLLAILAAYIAWQQYKTSFYSLNLARFDRRIIIYEHARAFLGKIIREADISFDEIGEFQRNVYDAYFLFDPAFSNYLHQIVTHANKLRAWNDMYCDTTMVASADYNHSEVVNGIHVELEWLAQEWDNLRVKFLPYLSIGNENAPTIISRITTYFKGERRK